MRVTLERTTVRETLPKVRRVPTAMTNLDLSYGQDIRLLAEDDREERSVRLFKFTRPVDKGRQDLQGRDFVMPDGSIFQHWGIWVEFEQTKKGKGRCIYTFDADVETDEKGETSFVDRWSAFLAGKFIVKVFAFYPDYERRTGGNGRHPYADSINWPDQKEHVIGQISPARLIKVAREVADSYKTYNLVFNNCQEFANDMRAKVAKSMTNVVQNAQPGNDWTAGDATTAIAAGMAVASGLAYLFSKLVSSNDAENEEEEDDDHDRHDVEASY